MYSNAAHDVTAGGSKIAVVLLGLTAVTAGYVVIFAGGPIAQSHGDLRVHGLIAILLAAVVGTLHCLTVKPAPRSGSPLERVALLVPAYAIFQATPLPLGIVRILSPERAGLADGLSGVMKVPGWVTLSVAPSATVYHALLFGGCTVIFFVMLDLCGRFSYRPWLVILPLTIIAAGEAVLGLVQVAGNPDGIAVGTYLIRNHYAGFLEMILPFVALHPFAVLASHESDRRNAVGPALLVCTGLGLSALIMAAILSSLSRMGFVASLLSIMFVIIAAAGRGRSRRGVSLIFSGAAVLALLTFIFVPSARLVMRFGEMEKNNEDRSPVWHETLRLVAAYPVFGCGLGGYESAFSKFKRSNPELNQDYAHNDYLQYLAELGVAGFLIVAIPLSIILNRLRAACCQIRTDLRWLSLACAGSVAAIGIHSFVDFNLYVPANLFTIAWILGVAAYCGKTASLYESMTVEPADIIFAPATNLRSKSYR